MAPAVSGHPDFDRAFRIQANTLEWLPLFLVSLWLFALAWNDDKIAAAIGVVWIVGRALYMTGYSKQADKRGPGFGIQALATGVLLFGALGKIVYGLVPGLPGGLTDEPRASRASDPAAIAEVVSIPATGC